MEPTVRPAAASGGHRPGLDGLRGVAVAAVVAYHLGYLQGGFLGVDVFFVLSGYLITGLALREVAGRGALSLRGFWGRRARRLAPALLAMVAGTLLAALALGWPHRRLGVLGWDAVATTTWWENWRQAAGQSYWEATESPFRHAWSLSVEEQFYVVWPLLVTAAVVAARRLRRPLVATVTVVAAAGAVASATWSVVLAHRLSGAGLSRVYVGTDTRAVAPLAGCALVGILVSLPAAAWVHRLRGAAGHLGAMVLVWLFVTARVDDPALYRHGWLVVTAVAAAAVTALASAAETTDRRLLPWLLTARPLRYLGARSYALYLWSWPLEVLVRFRWPDLSKGTVAAIVVAGSLGLAEASHRLLEHPLRRRAGWAARPALRRPAWGAVGAAAVGAIVLTFVVAVPPPVHERVDVTAAAAEALHAPPPTVASASGPSGLRVMVTGDSVAWTVGFYSPAPADLPSGISSVDSRAFIGCGILAGGGWQYHQEVGWGTPGGGICDEQADAERRGLAGHPDVVVLFPGAWEWSEVRSPDGHVVGARSEEMARLLEDRMLGRIAAAREAGARYALVEWSCPGPEAADVRRDAGYIDWINGVLRDTASTARSRLGADVQVVSPTAEVCVGGDPTAAPTPAKDEAMGNEVHLQSKAGGRWLWDRWLGPALTG